MNRSINIFHDFVDGPYGGGNQFLKALRDEFRALGRYADRPEAADIILINSHHPAQRRQTFESCVQLRKQGKRFIHRIDGPIQLVRGTDTGVDRQIYELNHVFADATVFQTEWSRCENIALGFEPAEPTSVVPNAPDPDIFHDDGSVTYIGGKFRLIATSWSSNWNKGFHTYEWLDQNLDWSNIEMTFVGNSPCEFSNIKCKPAMDSRVLAKELRAHHAYITASKNEPCSNALIEALHCGLPAIGFAGGGTPSLIGAGGLTFAMEDALPTSIEQLRSGYGGYQRAISLPSLGEVARHYLNLCASIQEGVPEHPDPEIIQRIRSGIPRESVMARIRRLISL